MMPAALLMLVLIISTAQAPAPPQAPAVTGIIAGRLTSVDLGRPVRKAEVKLVALSPKQTRITAAASRRRCSSLARTHATNRGLQRHHDACCTLRP